MGDSFDPPAGVFILGISGQRTWIADYSGLPIETQEWSGQRFVKAWISGQPVTTTVNIDLSGVSFASNVSGNVVYLVSGHNEIQGSFTADVSGQPVNVSGNAVRISGQTVIALISGQTVISNANISGNVVHLVSGQNNVQMSGQTVLVPFTSISGNVVLVPSTSVSGNAVRVSGETVIAEISGQTLVVPFTSVSGNAIKVSGQTFYPVSGNAYMFGFDQSGATWNEVFMDTSGGHRLKVAVSGDTVLTSVSGNVLVVPSTSISGNAVRISGQTVIAEISGQTVVVPSTSVSGNMVSISGQAVSISGNVVVASVNTNISGQTVYTASGNNAVQNSGQVSYLVSGQNAVQLYALDLSGLGLQPLVVNQSGGFALRVDAGAINVASNVSGNAVRTSGQVAYLVSGQNDVQISGQVVLISGQTVVASVTTNISGQTVYTASGNNDVQVSGQAVRISGQFVAVSGIVGTSISGNVVVVPSTSVSGNALATSGQVVYLTSGQAPVFNYGFIDASGQWTQLRVTQSGQGISGIPHKLPVTFSGDAIIGSVSGNMVSVSGQPVSVSGNVVLVSGQTVSVSGSITTSVSGNMVSVSGQAISVSGNAVRTSGDVVYLVSGQNSVAAYGFIDASGQLTQIRVTQSGQLVSGIPHKVVVTWSGDSIVGSVSGNMVSVSGQAISVSGNIVNTSGQVAIISGQPIIVSGAVKLSNDIGTGIASVDNVDDDSYGVSVLALATAGFGHGYDNVSNQWKRVRVTASGQGMSGIQHKVAVSFSGDSIIGSVSGNMVSISGQPVAISGSMVSISGQPVSVSGNMVTISGQVVNNSGYVSRVLPEGNNVTIRTASGLVCTSLSGGTQLPSLAADRLTIRMNPDHSGRMYLGSTTNPPFSGMGFLLSPGDGITLQVSNANILQVFASTSGEQVFFIAEDT